MTSTLEHTRIHWFSPLPPAKTEVADHTVRLLPEVSQAVELKLWTVQSTWDQELERFCPVERFTGETDQWIELNRGLSVYNIGNNAQFHYELWRISQQHAGVVELHDFRLTDLFSRWIHNEINRLKPHPHTRNGLVPIPDENDFANGSTPYSFSPVTEWALGNALGVIVHTEDSYRELIKRDKWAVLRIHLPFGCGEPYSRAGGVKDQYRIVMFGYLGSNRCLDSVLDALSEGRLGRTFRLDLFGTLWDGNHVRELIRQRGIEDIVSIHGFVDQKNLEEGLVNADMAVNLRNPTMGEASGSQLRIWAHGLPSIVSNIGWYAELPEGTVGYVRPGHEKEDLVNHLISFQQNPRAYLELGLKGYQFLKEKHSPSDAAQKIIRFLEHVRTGGLGPFVDYWSRRTASELREWLVESDLPIDRPSMQRIAEAISGLSEDSFR
jgi:glycosyltransferase involved in cell wall biosynthesis